MKYSIALISIICSLSFNTVSGQSLVGTMWTGSLAGNNFTLEFGINDSVYFAAPMNPYQAIGTYSVTGNVLKVKDLPGVSQCNPNDTGTYTYIINVNILNLTTVSDACSDRSNILSMTIWNQVFVGESELKLAVGVFPNPFDDHIKLKAAGISRELPYMILDLTGQKVREGVVNQSNNLINTSDLENGSYLLRFISLGQTIRLTKNNAND